MADVPLQDSARSQTSADARHNVPDFLRVSPGQEAEAPLQVSETSQVPAAARHTVPDFLRVLAGQ